MERNSRWWEAYAVRYFVGTAVGVVTILVLKCYANCEELKSLIQEFSQDSFKDAVVLGAGGLAFCYVASAPILMLHSLRAYLNQCFAIKKIAWITMLLILTMVPLFLMFFKTHTFGWFGLTFLLYLLVLGLQFRLVWCWRADKGVSLTRFYRDLVHARANRAPPPSPVGEFIESYKDMREHGNAFSIIVMEMVFGLVLAIPRSPGCLIGLILLWILPATTCWYLGTRLEEQISAI